MGKDKKQQAFLHCVCKNKRTDKKRWEVLHRDIGKSANKREQIVINKARSHSRQWSVSNNLSTRTRNNASWDTRLPQLSRKCRRRRRCFLRVKRK